MAHALSVFFCGYVSVSLEKEDVVQEVQHAKMDIFPHLLVLLGLLPPPPPLQSIPLRSALHHGVQGFPQHQVSVVEAPHT